MKTSFDRSARPLGQRGIAHLLFMVALLVGVAVVGVYLQVGDRGSASAAKSSKAKSGYIVVYSEHGKYDRVKIVAKNTNGGTCKGLNKDGVKKLSAKHGTKIKCSAINNLGSYALSYNNMSNPYTFVQERGIDVDAGYCVLTHPDQSQDKKLAVKDGKCEVDNDTITKQDVALRLLPTAGKENKYVNGYVSVSAQPAGTAVVRKQCVGSVSVSYGSDSNATKFSHPIKYANVDNKKYCVAKIRDRVNLEAGKTYTMNVSFPGTVFFNPASASIQFPSAAAKAKNSDSSKNNTSSYTPTAH